MGPRGGVDTVQKRNVLPCQEVKPRHPGWEGKLMRNEGKRSVQKWRKIN
jgi:hypothetical protein